MKDLVWYASYGSNLLYDRFMCYIKGGYCTVNNRYYRGCSDKTPPKDRRPITMNHELYFAEKSGSWEGKGVAFIKTKRDENVRTLGRMYLITKDQFTQVVRQENGSSPNSSYITINFKKTTYQGQSKINAGLYSRVIYLGEEEGDPKFTFTGDWDDDAIHLNKPCGAYLQTIKRGLKDTYAGMTDEEIMDYLRKAGGNPA